MSMDLVTLLRQYRPQPTSAFEFYIRGLRERAAPYYIEVEVVDPIKGHFRTYRVCTSRDGDLRRCAERGFVYRDGTVRRKGNAPKHPNRSDHFMAAFGGLA